MARPVSVTVVCWVIIALSLEALFGLASGFAGAILKDVLAGNPIPASKAVWLGAGTAVIHIVLAVFMLQRAAWARVVYFCLVGLALLGFLVFPPPITVILMLAIRSAVFAFFLFRPEANEYFSQTRTAAA
jgi:hypothetical protein